MPAKKGKRKNADERPAEGGLRVAYDEESGTHDVWVWLSGGDSWVKVSTNCEEHEAEQVADDLNRWKRGE